MPVPPRAMYGLAIAEITKPISKRKITFTLEECRIWPLWSGSWAAFIASADALDQNWLGNFGCREP